MSEIAIFRQLRSGVKRCPPVLDVLRFNFKGSIRKRDFVEQRIMFLDVNPVFEPVAVSCYIAHRLYGIPFYSFVRELDTAVVVCTKQ